MVSKVPADRFLSRERGSRYGLASISSPTQATRRDLGVLIQIRGVSRPS
jgi:hypothetical protein